MAVPAVVRVLLLIGAVPSLGSLVGCDPAQCLTDLSQQDCPKDTVQYVYRYQERVTAGQCCPGCKRFLAPNVACPSAQYQCAPGFKCIQGSCQIDTSSCLASASKFWTPKCLASGDFGPVQCKGERGSGRCFCSDAEGKRLDGQKWWTDENNHMCECSRTVAETAEHRTFHCDGHGRFEKLQCDKGLCWCTHMGTGMAAGPVLPAGMITLLPCYNVTAVGQQYLRKCDSITSAVHDIQELMKSHGTVYDHLQHIYCDTDGSYGPLTIVESQIECTWKNGSRISNFQGNLADINGINCNCARDALIFQESGNHTFTLQCKPNGNYANPQPYKDKTYCVDSDGYPTSEPQLVSRC